MLADLVSTFELLGMSRVQVEALLGPPDEDPWIGGCPGYDLGWVEEERLLLFRDLKPTPLLINYDADGRVIGYGSLYAVGGRCPEVEHP